MKLKEAKNAINQAEDLITSMMQMIEEQRYIIERYRLMHGNQLQSGGVQLPDQYDYYVSVDPNTGDATLVKSDILPRFQELKAKYHDTI